jgi:hypothetical protein
VTNKAINSSKINVIRFTFTLLWVGQSWIRMLQKWGSVHLLAGDLTDHLTSLHTGFT